MELRMPVAPDSPIFPAFTRVDAKADYALPQTTGGADNTGKVERGYIDLPVGGCAGNLIALSEGIRVGADGTVGFAVPPDTVGLLPVGTRWTGRFIRVDDPAKLTATRAAMGLCGKTPYTLTLSRGRLDRLAFVAELTAADRGVSGEVTAAPAMPYALPLSIAGLNPHWETGLWREGQPPDSPIPAFGVFEGKGIARLDVTKPGAFYAGNLLMADDLNLRLSIVGSQWTLKSITLEANNTTETDVETTVTTPVEIKDRYRLNEKIKVPAGMLLRFTFPKPAGQ